MITRLNIRKTSANLKKSISRLRSTFHNLAREINNLKGNQVVDLREENIAEDLKLFPIDNKMQTDSNQIISDFFPQ